LPYCGNLQGMNGVPDWLLILLVVLAIGALVIWILRSLRSP
jgi:hypothetical protein